MWLNSRQRQSPGPTLSICFVPGKVPVAGDTAMNKNGKAFAFKGLPSNEGRQQQINKYIMCPVV